MYRKCQSCVSAFVPNHRGSTVPYFLLSGRRAKLFFFVNALFLFVFICWHFVLYCLMNYANLYFYRLLLRFSYILLSVIAFYVDVLKQDVNVLFFTTQCTHMPNVLLRPSWQGAQTHTITCIPIDLVPFLPVKLMSKRPTCAQFQVL